MKGKKQAEPKGGGSPAPPRVPTRVPVSPEPETFEASAPPPPKEKKPSGFSMLLLLVHPRMVPEEALTFTRTCGLGGMAVVLLVLLAGTGALLLLALALASNFTGYLLPWDQLAFWAVTIGTGMLEYVPLVGPKTLSIFFVLHIAILPILGAILAAFHLCSSGRRVASSS